MIKPLSNLQHRLVPRQDNDTVKPGNLDNATSEITNMASYNFPLVAAELQEMLNHLPDHLPKGKESTTQPQLEKVKLALGEVNQKVTGIMAEGSSVASNEPTTASDMQNEVLKFILGVLESLTDKYNEIKPQPIVKYFIEDPKSTAENPLPKKEVAANEGGEPYLLMLLPENSSSAPDTMHTNEGDFIRQADEDWIYEDNCEYRLDYLQTEYTVEDQKNMADLKTQIAGLGSLFARVVSKVINNNDRDLRQITGG